MSYKPESNIGDFLTRFRPFGIPGIDSEFIGVETVPAALVRANEPRNVAMVQAGSSFGTATVTTTNGSPTFTSVSTVMTGMLVIGNNIPFGGGVTSSNCIESNSFTVTTASGAFEKGMCLYTSFGTTPAVSNQATTGYQTVLAYITNVSGNTITVDRSVSIPEGTRVAAAPVVVYRDSSGTTISNNANASGSTTLTFLYGLHGNIAASMVYVPQTIRVQHARMAFRSSGATITTAEPMPSDIQDARIMVWGPYLKNPTHFNTEAPLHAISRNLVQPLRNNTAWSDNSSLFTTSQVTIEPITGTAVSNSTTSLTSVNYTAGSERISSASGTNWSGTDLTTTGYTHTTGSTAPLNVNLSTYIGAANVLTWTISGRTAGSITINMAELSNSGITTTGSWTANLGVYSPANTVTIVPTSDFNGTIVLSVKDEGRTGMVVPANQYITATSLVLETTTSSTTQSNTGTNTLYLTSVTGLANGMKVFGTNIPVGATITGIQSATTPYSVTLSSNLTGNITTASPASIAIYNDDIPLGISTVPNAVSSSTSVTVADASSFRTGMAIQSPSNAIVTTVTVSSIAGNTLTLSGAVTLSAGAGVYGYTRASAASGTSNGTMTLTVASATSGTINWSAWPHHGYSSSGSTASAILLNVPSGSLKTNQGFSGPGMGGAALFNGVRQIAGNLWSVDLTINTFSGLPGLPMYHYLMTGTNGSSANSTTPTAGFISGNQYLVSGTVVNSGFLKSETRFSSGATSTLTKPAIGTTGACPAVITPTYMIRPNRALDTKTRLQGFYNSRISTGISTYNDTINFFPNSPTSAAPTSPAFNTPVTLQGGCYYLVGFWGAGTSYASPQIQAMAQLGEGMGGRYPLAGANKAVKGRYNGLFTGGWFPSSIPTSNVDMANWDGGFTVNGSAPTAGSIGYTNVWHSRTNSPAPLNPGVFGFPDVNTIYIALHE